LYEKKQINHNINGDYMENLVDIFLRSIISIIVLFLITELMGKKQLGQLNMFDYIIGITIGSLAATLAIDDSISYLAGIISMIVYGISATLISILTTKSIVLRRFFTSDPCVIMNDGKINYQNLKKSKLDINDLLQIARQNGYFDLSQIKYCILEPSGAVSFLPKSKYMPVTPNDMKLKVSDNGLCSNLVIDGNLMEKNIENIGKDCNWVIKRLDKMGYKNIDELLLVICDNKEKLTVYPKDNGIDIKIFD